MRSLAWAVWSATSRKYCWQVFGDPVFGEAAGQGLEDAGQRMGGALELDDFAGELVDAPGDGGVAAEDFGLDFVDVVFQPGNHGDVVVHDGVQDRVEHGFGAKAQQGRVVLEAPADLRQIGRAAVPDGDAEVRANKDVEFAEFDLFPGIQVAGCPQDDEQRLAVAFELGPLVSSRFFGLSVRRPST